MATWMVILLVGVITEQGYGWNLPNTYYQGAGNGYVGGRNGGTLSNQALAGASAGSWNAGGVGSVGGGYPFQGQSGGGISGGVDRTRDFAGNQWTGGNGRGGSTGGLVGGVSTDSVGADRTGYQQGGAISSSVPLATGSEGVVGGYNNQGSNFGPGQFNPNHNNGPAPDTDGGAFGASGAGFGAGGAYHHGNRLDTATYGRPSINSGPSVEPWRYGVPASYGGYGGTRWPWHGNGYVYRVPVAHVNPDGSYSFSYYTPHSSREEVGHSNGNVEGTYGFQNDGAKHNFSFNAGPDVDLRSTIGNTRAGALNPEEYGPQSVHSRARLPLAPASFRPGAQLPNSWSSRGGVDGGTVTDGENANDQSTLAVVGLPKTSTEATDISQPTTPNQIVRGSTEPVGTNDLDGRLSQPNDAGLTGVQGVTQDGTVTTVRPLDGSVEQVVTRPENEVPSYSNEISQNGGARDGGAAPIDRSYRFGYQTPDAAREEAADQDGNVRGSFSYNNEVGRNDLQYVAGAGMGFRPTGGSLSVPNGLPAAGSVFGGDGTLNGAGFGDDGGSSAFQNQGGQVGAGVEGSFRGVGFAADGRRLASGNQGTQFGTGVGNDFGGATDFGASGSQAAQLGAGAGGSGGSFGTGFGGDGRSLASGNQGTQFGVGTGGSGGPFGTGFGSDGRSLASSNQGTQLGTGAGGSGGSSGTGFGGDGRSLASGNQGTQFGIGTGGLGGSGGSGGSFGPVLGGDRNSLPSGDQGTQLGTRAGGSGGSFGTGFGGDGRSLASGNQGTQFGAGTGGSEGSYDIGFGSDGRSLASGNQGTQFGVGTGGSGGSFGTGFGGDGRPLASGNQGTQFGVGTGESGGSFGTGFGGDGRSLASGNQGTQFGVGTGESGGSFGTGFGGDGRSLASGNQGTQFGAGTSNAFGGNGKAFDTGYGNQGTQFGAGGNFGGSDGRSFGFGNQAGQGFSPLGRGATGGFTGSQGTTRNPVTRSPPVNAFNGFTGSVPSASREDGTEENTTINAEDSDQTTTFGGYGDVQSGSGLFTNGNRRLIQ